jgi:hypothetical protein
MGQATAELLIERMGLQEQDEGPLAVLLGRPQRLGVAAVSVDAFLLGSGARDAQLFLEDAELGSLGDQPPPQGGEAARFERRAGNGE